MKKKMLIVVLIASLTLNACENNIGSAGIGSATNRSLFSGNESESSSSIDEESLKDYRRGVLETNDVLAFNRLTANKRLVYLNSADGLQTLDGVTIPPETVADNDKLIKFVSENKPKFVSVANINKPNNSNAIYYDNMNHQIHYLTINGSKWQEYGIDVSSEPLQVKLLQESALQVEDTNKELDSIYYTAGELPGVHDIQINYLNNKVTNEDGEAITALVNETHLAQSEYNQLYTTALKPNNGKLSLAVSSPYIYTDGITKDTAAFIADKLGGEPFSSGYPDSGAFNWKDAAVIGVFTLLTAIVGYFTFHSVKKNSELYDKLTKIKEQMGKSDLETNPKAIKNIAHAAHEILSEENAEMNDPAEIKVKQTNQTAEENSPLLSTNKSQSSSLLSSDAEKIAAVPSFLRPVLGSGLKVNEVQPGDDIQEIITSLKEKFSATTMNNPPSNVVSKIKSAGYMLYQQDGLYYLLEGVSSNQIQGRQLRFDKDVVFQLKFTDDKGNAVNTENLDKLKEWVSKKVENLKPGLYMAGDGSLLAIDFNKTQHVVDALQSFDSKDKLQDDVDSGGIGVGIYRVGNPTGFYKVEKGKNGKLTSTKLSGGDNFTLDLNAISTRAIYKPIPDGGDFNLYNSGLFKDVPNMDDAVNGAIKQLEKEKNLPLIFEDPQNNQLELKLNQSSFFNNDYIVDFLKRQKWEKPLENISVRKNEDNSIVISGANLNVGVVKAEISKLYKSDIELWIKMLKSGDRTIARYGKAFLLSGSVVLSGIGTFAMFKDALSYGCGNFFCTGLDLLLMKAESEVTPIAGTNALFKPDAILTTVYFKKNTDGGSITQKIGVAQLFSNTCDDVAKHIDELLTKTAVSGVSGVEVAASSDGVVGVVNGQYYLVSDINNRLCGTGNVNPNRFVMQTN